MDTVEALYIDENRVHLIIRDSFEGDIPFLEAVVSRSVEEWLDWEKYTNPYSMKDDVTGLERA